MRKKILEGVMLVTMVLSLTACVSKKDAADDKVNEKIFGETLDLYATYYKDEINPNDTSDYGVTITLDKNAMPVMIVAELSGDVVNRTIYAVENKKVEAIKDFRKLDDAIYTYMDGIIRVKKGSNEYEYYQLDGSELININEVIKSSYEKWNTETAKQFKSNNTEINYKYLRVIGTALGVDEFHIGNDSKSEITFKQISLDISELFDSIYAEIYPEDVKISAYNSWVFADADSEDNEDYVGHVLSSPLLSYGEMYELSSSEFQYYIRALKEKGSMNWKDYYVWHWNFFFTESDNEMDGGLRLGLEDVIQRDFSLMDKMEIFNKQEDSSKLYRYKTAVVLYALYNK